MKNTTFIFLIGALTLLLPFIGDAYLVAQETEKVETRENERREFDYATLEKIRANAVGASNEEEATQEKRDIASEKLKSPFEDRTKTDLNNSDSKSKERNKNFRDDDLLLTGRKKLILRASSVASGEKGTLIGREIADYRTISGEGKYVFEDDRGILRMIPGSEIELIEDAPDSTLGELRKKISEELLDEFGDGFSTKTSEQHAFVYDCSDGYAEWCIRLFENLSEGFERYAKSHSIELNDRAEPMVVVIFATKADFMRYASKETPNADQVAAYYNMETNRVVLYDLSQTEGTYAASTRRRREYLETKEFLSRPNAEFNVATIVHEATHQIAFNRGLFQRTGPFALWTVEGLSLLFETPNGKASQGGWGYRSNFPKNERQLAFFEYFMKRSIPKDLLRDLIRQEKFMNDIQGSYSTSWALFYYMHKKRPKALAAYMKEIANRPPGIDYAPEERVEDFEKFFGDNWEKLTESLLRFVKRL